MILKCPISGVSWKASGFLFRASHPHPIFSLSWEQLSALSRQWRERRMSQEDTKLYCAALLNATALVQWTEPARLAELPIEAAEVAIDRLLEFNGFLHDTARRYQRDKYFPLVRITEHNASLKNLDAWLDTWNDCITEYFRELAAARAAREQAKRDEALAVAIRTAYKQPSKYIKALAAWTATAASFPDTPIKVLSEGSYKTLKTSDYWQYIICCMGTKDTDYRLYAISGEDIECLQDWVLTRMPLSSTNAFMVAELINEALHDLSFFGGQNYQLAASSTAAKETNKQLLEQPMLERPDRAAFTSALEYARAVALYNSQQAALAAAQNGVT